MSCVSHGPHSIHFSIVRGWRIARSVARDSLTNEKYFSIHIDDDHCTYASFY